MTEKKHQGSLLSENRKARHLYEILERAECGLVLTGPEVKSLKSGGASFTDSYIDFRDGEAWILNMHIAPYRNGGYAEQVPERPRKALLHKSEIRYFADKTAQKGLTVVPLRLYLHHGLIKLEIGLGRGKKLYDNRIELKKRAEMYDAQHSLLDR